MTARVRRCLLDRESDIQVILMISALSELPDDRYLADVRKYEASSRVIPINAFSALSTQYVPWLDISMRSA
jgi:hypothetical protein